MRGHPAAAVRMGHSQPPDGPEGNCGYKVADSRKRYLPGAELELEWSALRRRLPTAQSAQRGSQRAATSILLHVC